MAIFDTTRPAASAGLFQRTAAAVIDTIGALAAWNDVRVTRNRLSKLTERELADIGLARGDIDFVARR